jgi:hypothetical protein
MLWGLPTLSCLELNPSTGEPLRSTVSLESAKLDALLKSGPIRCAVVYFEYTHLATVGDDKQSKVWVIDSPQRRATKRPYYLGFHELRVARWTYPVLLFMICFRPLQSCVLFPVVFGLT